jgi:hypothetical protein
MEICLVRFSLEQFGVLSGSILSRVLLDKIWGFGPCILFLVPILKDFRTLEIGLDQFCAIRSGSAFFFFLMLNSRVIFMTVEVNVFYAYFEGFISDR